jgi:acylphosphatase
MSLARVRCLVHGRVQGVYFRAATRQQAHGLGLTGWVRNCSDGTVEVLAEGEQTSLQHLVEWCHHGPPGARVTRLEVHWDEPAGHLEPFEIRYW